ncbi:MAG: hypothetical protein E6K56_09650 [Ignavibacteria bacterium]|nr:MAG: hypothetical protein E6K56_09650 [Ignavibacteria bacterium]
MMEEGAVAAVLDEEWLARFVLFRKWIRSDRTVKPDAFIPYPYPNLSVTRHVGLMDSEPWEIGQDVADARPATLYGRADLQAVNFRRQSLAISATPRPRNHANVSGWPPDKPSQKIVAQEIAALAVFIRRP